MKKPRPKNVADTMKGITTIRADIKNLLARIGVFDGIVSYDLIRGEALISFSINGNRVEKRLSNQPDARRNLQALSMWLKNRIIGFEREIEKIDEGFHGYMQIEGSTAVTDIPLSTPYELLGCKETDSNDVIEREYKRQAFLWHPDRHSNDVVAEERFKEVNGAWQKIKSIRGI